VVPDYRGGCLGRFYVHRAEACVPKTASEKPPINPFFFPFCRKLKSFSHFQDKICGKSNFYVYFRSLNERVTDSYYPQQNHHQSPTMIQGSVPARFSTCEKNAYPRIKVQQKIHNFILSFGYYNERRDSYSRFKICPLCAGNLRLDV
jgi:hypothetical protein